ACVSRTSKTRSCRRSVLWTRSSTNSPGARRSRRSCGCRPPELIADHAARTIARRPSLVLAVDVEPAIVLAHEARPLVEHAQSPIRLEIGGAEFHEAVSVGCSAADRIDDLQPPPTRVVAEVKRRRSGGRMPGAQQPRGIATRERLEPRS